MKVQETKMIPENNISGSKETIDKLARTEKLLNDAQDEIILLKKKLKDAENEIEVKNEFKLCVFITKLEMSYENSKTIKYECFTIKSIR